MSVAVDSVVDADVDVVTVDAEIVETENSVDSDWFAAEGIGLELELK